MYDQYLDQNRIQSTDENLSMPMKRGKHKNGNETNEKKKNDYNRLVSDQNVAVRRMFKDIPRGAAQIAHKLHHSAVVLIVRARHKAVFSPFLFCRFICSLNWPVFFSLLSFLFQIEIRSFGWTCRRN